MAVVKNNAALDVLMVKRFFLLHKVSLNDCVLIHFWSILFYHVDFLMLRSDLYFTRNLLIVGSVHSGFRSSEQQRKHLHGRGVHSGCLLTMCRFRV